MNSFILVGLGYTLHIHVDTLTHKHTPPCVTFFYLFLLPFSFCLDKVPYVTHGVNYEGYENNKTNIKINNNYFDG